ncbi:MAG: glycosyltransferase [Anaerolineae bacterium]|nr:glycosyltransferase [Anaerolineae bacterium]
MKLLVLASSLDLQQPFSSTPSWWQLLKGLYEEGVDLVVTTYQGPAIETLWWRAVPNPVRWQGDLFQAARGMMRRLAGARRPPIPPNQRLGRPSPTGGEGGESPQAQGSPSLSMGEGTGVGAESLSDRLVRRVAQTVIAPRWQSYLDRLLREQPDIAAVLVLTVPLNHIRGVARFLSDKHGKPVLYYDGDLPASLPAFSGFASGFRIYQGADPGEFTAILGNSVQGLEYVRALGARETHVFQYAADPEVWSPLDVPQDVDAFFYGHGREYREAWIEAMIAAPARALPERRFAVRGTKLGDLGPTGLLPYLSFSKLREYACRSKLNLVITRRAHTSVYGSSTARPFELAALGACMVSSPYEGVGEWFEPEREIVVLSEVGEATERIRWLLDHDDARRAIGQAARGRFLREHTYRHRARQLVGIVSAYL